VHRHDLLAIEDGPSRFSSASDSSTFVDGTRSISFARGIAW